MPHHQLPTRCIEARSWSSVVKHDQVHISFPGATHSDLSLADGLDCDLDCRSSVFLCRRWKVIPRICVYLSIGHYVPYSQAPHLYSLPVTGGGEGGITRKLQWTRLLFYNGQYSKIVLSFIKIAHADADLNWTITRTISFTTNTYCTWGQNAIRHEWRVKLVLILSGTMSIMYLVGKDNGYVDCWVSGDQRRRVDQLYKC